MTHPAVTLPDYLQLELPEPPPERPYVLVNMVSSADGKIVIEGTEVGLGSPADQRLMRALRTNVDAVLNGASTLRKSGSSPRLGDSVLEGLRTSRGLPKTPLGVVLTGSGRLPLDAAFFTETSFEAVVFATDETPADRLEALRSSGRAVEVVAHTAAAVQMLRVLRTQYGVRSLLCEGGAHLNGHLFDAGLVDECFLTIAPRIVGGDVTLTPVAGDRPASFSATWPLKLVSAVTNPASEEVYLRYRVAELAGIVS